MTTKKVLLALAATSLFAFASVAPVYAEDPPAPADDGATMDVPADPDSAGSGDMAPDPGADPGMDAGDGSGTDGGDTAPQPE
jgi:hypothetical protein